MKIDVFEYLNQRVMYSKDVNYYVGIQKNNIGLGEHELSEEDFLRIFKENDPEEFEVFSRSSIAQRQEKMNTIDLEEIKEESSKGQFTLCLHPSRKCNLNCKYCFKDSEYLGNEELSFQVAKDAIDFLVDIYAPGASKYVVDLSGSGEPLLQFGLIREIVEYCKQKRNEVCKNIEVMFCTNLTLLTPEMVAYLDNEPAIILGTSIDGDQITHDGNRVYASGGGTYADVVKGLNMFQKKKLGIAVTITPLNQDVDLIYDHLYRLPNVDCVSMNLIRCFNGTNYDFENFDIDNILNRYERLCNKFLKELQKENFDYLKKILRGADFFSGFIIQALFQNTMNLYKCDAGKNRISVSSTGDIYACSVMTGNKDFYIGNIYLGTNTDAQNKFFLPNITLNEKCIKCDLNILCGGECYVNAYQKNENFFDPLGNLCKLKRELIKLSRSLVQRIKFECPEIYCRLLNFACHMQSHFTTDPWIWAVMKFLKSRGYQTDFETIQKEFAHCNTVGASPVDVLNCIKKYVDADAYKVDFASDKNKLQERLKGPAIGVINKTKNSRYQYLIVLGTANGIILFNEIGRNGQAQMLLQTFLKECSDLFLF